MTVSVLCLLLTLPLEDLQCVISIPGHTHLNFFQQITGLYRPKASSQKRLDKEWLYCFAFKKTITLLGVFFFKKTLANTVYSPLK